MRHRVAKGDETVNRWTPQHTLILRLAALVVAALFGAELQGLGFTWEDFE